jgi:cytochrome c biogenesis protein CcdA
MVLGIVALVTFFSFCGLGVIPAIIALVKAPAARREIEASGGALEGAGQIRAGVIMSWITLGLTVLAIVVLVIAVVVLVAVSDNSTTVHSAWRT